MFSATVDSNIIVVRKDSPYDQPSLYYFDEDTEGTTLQEMLLNGQESSLKKPGILMPH